MLQFESLTRFFHPHGPGRRDGSFFPMDIPSAPMSRAVWRYTPRIGHDLCPLASGFLAIQDWKRPLQR